LQFGKLFLLGLLFAVSPALGQQRLIEPGDPGSARPAAMQVLRHLADGNIDAAAAMSNAPQRRLEVLRDYRDKVGEEELKRIYGRYFAPENRVIAEVAIGPRRMIVWELGDAGYRIAGQIYVEVDGKFVMDDVPSRERSELRELLRKYL
jgi:hypothetical protein